VEANTLEIVKFVVFFIAVSAVTYQSFKLKKPHKHNHKN